MAVRSEYGGEEVTARAVGVVLVKLWKGGVRGHTLVGQAGQLLEGAVRGLLWEARPGRLCRREATPAGCGVGKARTS